MIIRNNTNGKEVTLTNSAFQSLSRVAKANFTIISEEDSKLTDQIVKSTTEVKKAAPDNGSKKAVEKK